MNEQAKNEQKIIQQGWLRGVAITTTILAVLTSVVTAHFNACTTETQLVTSEQDMKWQYYQSKSFRGQLIEIKKLIVEGELDDAPTPEKRAGLEDQIKVFDEYIHKYDIEKQVLSMQAKSLGKKKDRTSKQGYIFMIAVVLYQISIMLSSVAALLQRRYVWIVGLLFGVVATVVFVNGFLLLFEIPKPTLPGFGS